MSMTTLGQRPSPREKSLLSREESPPQHNVAKDGGGNLSSVVTLPIISRSRKSTKAEKSNESVKRKGCHYHIRCLVPDTAIPLCPYNHSQQLERRADGTSTYPRNPIQEKGNYYKKGVKWDRKDGAKTPQHTRGPEKKRLPRPWQGPILSDESDPPQPNRKEYHDDRCSYAKT